MVKKGLVFLVVLVVLAITMNAAFAANDGQKAKAKWTFIVFLNGDNNLDPYGDKDMVEMKKIGSTADVNVVVLQDHTSKPAQKLYVKKGSVEVLETIGKIDTGDYKELVKFVKWAHETYPAEKYLVDIWNHGAGWKKSKKAKVFKGISYDDGSGNHITTPQLGEAMKQIKAIIGHNVDVLGMDACLMQMMEVGYEVKDSVDCIAASEETEPGNGWPYDLILGPLVKTPTMTASELGILTVQAYKKAYSTGSENTTQSAVDCSKFDAVCAKLEAFATAMIAKLSDAKIKAGLKKAANEVQVYAYDDNCDLGHFCQLVNANVKDDAINKAATELLAVLVSAPSKLVLANSITGPGGVKNSTGLAIYLPKTSVASNYKTIMLGKTAWANFISAFLR
jgi:hypothetical protein